MNKLKVAATLYIVTCDSVRPFELPANFVACCLMFGAVRGKIWLFVLQSHSRKHVGTGVASERNLQRARE